MTNLPIQKYKIITCLNPTSTNNYQCDIRWVIYLCLSFSMWKMISASLMLVVVVSELIYM